MTKLLDSAFEKISSFSESEQNAYARIILDEIELEKKWDHSFSNSENLLEDMASEALNDYNSNQSVMVDYSKL